LSDFQGVVLRQGVVWDATQLLRRCGLRAWHFDHLLVSQAALRPYHWFVEDSPHVDLTGGFAAYLARLDRREENPFPHITTKAGKLQRQVGPVRLDFDSQDQRVFDTMLDWKSQQYQRTNATNVFAFPWTRALLQRIFRCRGEAFAGRLSALYAGDRLVAVHFGMCSYGVFHFWFPAYDVGFAKYSPGLIRDLEITKLVAAAGFHRADYGKGLTDQKTYFMSAASQVAVGSVDLRLLAGPVRRQWQRAYSWARQSPLRAPARVPARVLYRIREWLAFR
jgi:CelD/BcsL family acetyltransferase involved in cellulose biosynthesis